MATVMQESSLSQLSGQQHAEGRNLLSGRQGRNAVRITTPSIALNLLSELESEKKNTKLELQIFFAFVVCVSLPTINGMGTLKNWCLYIKWPVRLSGKNFMSSAWLVLRRGKGSGSAKILLAASQHWKCRGCFHPERNKGWVWSVTTYLTDDVIPSAQLEP